MTATVRVLLKLVVVMLAIALVLTSFVVFFVGPWPLYTDSDYKHQAYYTEAIAAIDAAAGKTHVDAAPGALRAGWAEHDITPPAAGHPLAGYSGRENDKHSTGVHERIHVRALAMNDGVDTVVLVGSDLLQTLPNLLAMVEPRIRERAGLTNANVMYTSSHTHCGPGGFAPGRVAELSFGAYSPEYLEFMAEGFAGAIREAAKNLAPARFAHGAVDAPEFIRNRCREGAPVDSTMHVGVVEWADGKRLYLTRYSAHGTAYGEEMMELNGDWTGAFQRAVQAASGTPLVYLGGAVGSMRPYPPGPPMPAPRNRDEAMGFENDVESALVREGKKTREEMLRDQEARVEAMGKALAEKLLAAAPGLKFEDHLDVAAFDAPYTPPPAQVRMFSPNWRLSPHAFALLGVPTTGRLQAARIGSMLLVGLPYDVCGELSREWQAKLVPAGVELWVTSFSGAYLGYLSPDKYYKDIGEAYGYNQNYELAEMGWFGPNQGAYVEELVMHAAGRLGAATEQ